MFKTQKIVKQMKIVRFYRFFLKTIIRIQSELLQLTSIEFQTLEPVSKTETLKTFMSHFHVLFFNKANPTFVRMKCLSFPER